MNRKHKPKYVQHLENTKGIISPPTTIGYKI